MRFSTVYLMEKAEMNQPLFIFLFDSRASKHLTLTQKTQLVFLRWDFSAYCNNRDNVSCECWDTVKANSKQCKLGM